LIKESRGRRRRMGWASGWGDKKKEKKKKLWCGSINPEDKS
jgi:hypothetical protein